MNLMNNLRFICLGILFFISANGNSWIYAEEVKPLTKTEIEKQYKVINGDELVAGTILKSRVKDGYWSDSILCNAVN